MVKEVDALAALKAHCEKFKTQGDAASSLAVSKQYLNDMLRGRRELSPRLLGKLGLRKAVVKA